MPKGGALVAPPEEDIQSTAEETKPSETHEKKPPPSPRPEAGAKKTDGVDAKGPEKPFAIFTLLDGVSSGPGPINTEQLVKHLAAIDQYLRHKTGFADRRRYLSCPSESHASVYKKLEAQGLDMSEPSGYGLMDNQVDAFNTAATVFGFFLPFSVGIPTAAKFWGALVGITLVR